ncbi:MAG: carboxypeptidase regulatory-like domain-containing protein [Bdellovibrio sp.]|nr:carboxypeptidase regulatory-like domain-containing protein [Bdellovibrio sp.]
MAFWALLAALSCSAALAYVPSVTPLGLAMKWKNAKINVAGNAQNLNGISSQDFFDSVVKGLQRWKYASFQELDFDYWQGTDLTNFPTQSAMDGKSTIYFASSAPSSVPRMASNVLGVTQVWFNPDTGNILEADISLNDLDYVFTMNPKDTSGYGSLESARTQDRPRVFIQNVITHELGHALGLSHTGNLQATMLFTESPEQAHLGCDDLAGIRTLYPSPSRKARGSIEGTVTDEQGNPLFGAHIVAVSETRGTALSTGISQANGSYRIDGLIPDRYYLMAEPFYAGSGALPSFYSKMDFHVCPQNKAFIRTFLTGTGSGQPTPIEVQNDRTTSSPPFSVNCSGGITQTAQPPTAPLIDGKAAPSGGFGFLGRFSNTPDFQLFSLKGLAGSIEIHALSYSLYSPIHLSLSILDANGNPVSATLQDPVYQGTSGYQDFDSTLTAEDLPPGDYWLKVSGDRLNYRYYPAPSSLDRVPFFLLTGRWGSAPRAELWKENSRCSLTENYPPYQSPPGNPPTKDVGTTGFCGGIADVSKPSDPKGGGGLISSVQFSEQVRAEDSNAVIGWFIPWAILVLCHLGINSRLKKGVPLPV